MTRADPVSQEPAPPGSSAPSATPAPSLEQVLFEQAPVGLAFLDRDLRYVRLNQALATMTGVTIQQHLGRTVAELWPALPTRVVAELRNVLATGVPVENLDTEIVAPGEPDVIRSLMLSFRPVRDASGDVMGLNCSVVEITAQKAAETEARRARDDAKLLARLNARLASVTDRADAARVVVQTTRAAFGAATARLFLREGAQLHTLASSGYPPEIRDTFDTWPADGSSPAGAAMAAGELRVWPDPQALEQEFPVHAAAMESATGERALVVAPLVVHGAAIGALQVGFNRPHRMRDDDETNVRAVADVAAQAISRIQLVDSERRGRQMLVASVEQMPMGVIVVNDRGLIVHANEVSRRIWHGQNPPPVLSDDDRYVGYHPGGRPYGPTEWPSYRSATIGEVVVAEEIALDTFEGQRILITASSAPIEDADGRRIGAVVVFADVTDRRRSEEVREAFLGMLSHELRTPVTSIYGAAQLLRKGGDAMAPEVRATLTTDVADAAGHLARLVENLLVLSLAEHGATTVDPAPVLIQHLVTRLIQQEGSTWPNCRLSVQVTNQPVPAALGDEAVVTLILRNLIGNAAKYAPGDLTVTIEPREREVRIAVRDRGPGIPPAEIDSIFDLFHRAAVTAGRAPGSGIGLFVVRHLAEAQGGHAWATNLQGGGAEVGFSLPIADDPDRE